jgi:RHS repeat-associated protein
MKTANGVTYAYDGDGRRVYKSNGKLYWYGAGGDILAETDLSGVTLNEYIFFGGKRVAMLPAGGNPIYYVGDMLGTSRLITQNNGAVCYDADFDPFGGEHAYTNTCSQNYKFEGKERDTETGNDDFGARSYSSRFGRWLSADWSNVPVPVPYANLTNPQTLNLYSMVSDDPESFADLDGHTSTQMYQVATPGAGSAWDPAFAGSMTDDSGLTLEEHNAMAAAEAAQAAQQTTAATTATPVTTTTTATAVEKTAQQEIDKVVKPLIESAAEEAGAVAGILSKVFGAVAGVVIELATAPATARDEDMLNAHRKGARPSTEQEHQKGEARRKADRGGEKGDREGGYPRKPPKDWRTRGYGNRSGKWPPTNRRDKAIADDLLGR